MTITVTYGGINFECTYDYSPAEEFYDASIDDVRAYHEGDEFTELIDMEAIEKLIWEKIADHH